MEAADFINKVIYISKFLKLIERKPNNRLGINGPQDVKNHIWIRNISWDLLQKRKLVSPFIPVHINLKYFREIKITLIRGN